MKYITLYFTSFVVLITSIATFNWLVDPFAMYWSPKIVSLNQLKPEAGTRTRISKAYQIKNIDPEVLIVGNSRVEMGLSPKSDLFQNKVVYNQGMPGSHLVMQTDFAIDAIKSSQNIKHLLIGVDFLDFLLSKEQLEHENSLLDNTIKESYSFRLESHEVKYASLLRLKEKIGLIFSLDTLSASLKTIAKQNSLASSINEFGFNSALSYLEIIRTEGIKPLFTQKLQEISTRLNTPLYIVSPKNALYSPRFKHLKALIDEAKRKNIKITLFINPYHFSYLHALAEKNQWGNFLTWKESLTSFVHKLNSVDVTLWDFSGFNNIINETVPLATPKIPMIWFWEPAHYRKELGDKMLTVMLVKGKSTKVDFGRKLSQRNIEHYIADDQAGFNKSLLHWQLLKDTL
jgi:hypothetical protein